MGGVICFGSMACHGSFRMGKSAHVRGAWFCDSCVGLGLGGLGACVCFARRNLTRVLGETELEGKSVQSRKWSCGAEKGLLDVGWREGSYCDWALCKWTTCMDWCDDGEADSMNDCCTPTPLRLRLRSAGQQSRWWQMAGRHDLFEQSQEAQISSSLWRMILIETFARS